MFALYRDEPEGTRHIEPVSLIVSSQVAGVENTAVDSGENISISFTLLVCVCVRACVRVCVRACVVCDLCLC